MLGLPLELGLHQPLLALGVSARLQKRRGRVVFSWSGEAVAGVDVLNCEILQMLSNLVNDLVKKLIQVYSVIISPLLVSAHSMTANKVHRPISI